MWNTQGRMPHDERGRNIDVVCPRGKKCQGLPTTTRNEKRGKEEPFLWAFRGSKVLPPSWFQASNLHNCERIHFCCFKLPSLWSFVTAAPGNYCVCLLLVLVMWASLFPLTTDQPLSSLMYPPHSDIPHSCQQLADSTLVDRASRKSSITSASQIQFSEKEV